MVRAYITSAVAGAFLLGMATAAMALTGEYGNMCTMGLASGKDIQTDCSVNTQIQGKTYCFGSTSAMTQFMADPSGNLAKAQAYYSKKHPDKQGFDDMRVLMVTLTAMTLLLVTGRAEAEKLGGEGEPKGDEFLRQKKPKVAKDYYVVPTGQSHQCSIVAGEWEKKPAGALGGAPYASADYAKAALKTFPECKGGEPDEETDKKHRKK